MAMSGVCVEVVVLGAMAVKMISRKVNEVECKCKGIHLFSIQVSRAVND